VFFFKISWIYLIVCLYSNHIEASSWAIKGDTQETNLYYFNILPHSTQRLSYSSFEWHGVREGLLKWPDRFMASYGIGHRESITSTQSMGLYVFIDVSLDINQIHINQTSNITQSLQNRCYDRYFLNLDTGIEWKKARTQVELNFKYPLSMPFTSLEKTYLSHQGAQVHDFERVISAFPSEKKEEKRQQLQKIMETTFYHHNGQRWQRYYYLEEGSYVFTIKLGYHFLHDWNAVLGVYYLRDPYQNNTLGFSGRLSYLYSNNSLIYLQYIYDAARSWKLRGGIHWLLKNHHLNTIPAYRHLWRAPDRHLSPVLVRNHSPRKID
jgi:hypothetical protein